MPTRTIVPVQGDVRDLHVDVTAPGIICADDSIKVISSYSQYQDNEIRINPNLCHCIAMNIIDREMKIFKDKEPNVDLSKIQEMIDSPDIEMNNLAYEILGKHTKYTVNLLKNVRSQDVYGIINIIEEYTKNNKLNITDEIR